MNIGFKYGFRGIRKMLSTEKNFKIHLFLFLLLVVASLAFNITRLEWCMVLLCSALVFSLEMLNSALEKICDKIEPNQNAEIAWIKDVAAGAVLVAAIFSLVIAALIFIPYILELCTTFEP
ncbi:undecaprenol kinase/diacylglycerol kinase (ATP) [Lishizhenia tianjinensis]|uniref:Undecaprenol kinase/diacylglycerol kinase (ATP) n=1 Tax=Lishizhenia tianjinensis TaxID=477690 RepID=A0A1I7BEN0_9FLAO|nr:diacylglycerol kinase family protein [Lishizhenia tianjinensis]SFT85666.1 undecaprenol kinase/diacylglycerol kinase (ATP) [Lishizhenia tianjinensis]